MRYICSDNADLNLCVAMSLLPISQNTFDFYPFSNEHGFKNVIQVMQSIQASQEFLFTHMALLTGESNIISLLPELVQRVKIIVCNDINTSVILHTRFLIDCLLNSSSIEQFETVYFADLDKCNLGKEEALENFQIRSQKLGADYFLSSDARFQLCKKSAHELSFIWTQIDLTDYNHIVRFTELINLYNAKFVVLNLSNIHHYCNCIQLSNNISLLTSGYTGCSILFSCGMLAADKQLLRTKIVFSLGYYLQFLLDTHYECPDKTDWIAVVVRSNLHRFNLDYLINKVNQRIQKYYALNVQQAPKVVIKEEDNNYRFFAIKKSHLSELNLECFKSIVSQFLPIFTTKWFLTSEDILANEINISFSFLWQFVQKTNYLDRDMTQDDLQLNRTNKFL